MTKCKNCGCKTSIEGSNSAITRQVGGKHYKGKIQPIELIGEECKRRNIIYHTDATQIVGKKSIIWNDLDVDFLSASAHKFQGPKGFGLLIAKSQILEQLSSLKSGVQEGLKKACWTHHRE